MKKLTAGIFATLLAVVSADGAYAAIASQGYVDDKVDTVEATVATKADKSALDTLSGTVTGHTTQIGTINTKIGGYGDIVTHDASEFATAAEGDLATSAVQPADITNVERTTNKTQTVNAQSTEAQYPSAKAVWTAVQSVDANASVEALEGRVDSLETNSATKTELATKQNKNMGSSAANSIVTTDGTGNITASETIAASKVSGLGSLATKSSVATADIASQAVTKEKLATDIVTSLDKADTALQKTTADTTYAVKSLETQVGTVSKENMGTTTATTVVAGVKEAIDAAKAADTKAGSAASAASTAQRAAEAADSKAQAAQATADAAIPAPDGECASGTAKCVLTFNNSVYAWEVIARNGEGQ